MNAHLVFVSVASAVATFCLLPVILRELRRWQIFDEATSRSSHSGRVPRGGGAAMAIGTFGVLLPIVVLVPEVSGPATNLVLAVVAAFSLLGLYDDFRSLPAISRLLVQFAISLGCVVAVEHLKLESYTMLEFGVAVVWLVVSVNAFNFMDGINGISCLSATAIGLSLALLDAGELPVVGLLLAAVVGSSLGFLPWNFPKAKVFMGDSGSYLLGAGLGTAALLSSGGSGHSAIVVLPFGIYLTDTGTTLLTRAMRGLSLTEAHRDHTYQVVANEYLGHAGTAAIVAILSGALGLAALFLTGTSLAIQVLTVCVVLTLLIAYKLTPTALRTRS